MNKLWAFIYLSLTIYALSKLREQNENYKCHLQSVSANWSSVTEQNLSKLSESAKALKWKMEAIALSSKWWERMSNGHAHSNQRQLQDDVLTLAYTSIYRHTYTYLTLSVICSSARRTRTLLLTLALILSRALACLLCFYTRAAWLSSRRLFCGFDAAAVSWSSCVAGDERVCNGDKSAKIQKKKTKQKQIQ